MGVWVVGWCEEREEVGCEMSAESEAAAQWSSRVRLITGDAE